MAAPADSPFFPPRAAREVLDGVLTGFPFPLALTYARLQEELDHQEPIAAVWALRDAFEVLLKFVASLALADALRSDPPHTHDHTLLPLLLKPNGLALGDWHTLLEDALKPLADPALTAQRALPDLYPLFFSLTGSHKRTPLNAQIDGAGDTWVHWRNSLFGHGVFRDRADYAREIEHWLPRLHTLYQALTPLLADWQLLALDDAGHMDPWQGVGHQAAPSTHVHLPGSAPRPVLLLLPRSGRRLRLAPFLSLHRCGVCGLPALFFFDKPHRTQRDRLELLDYEFGHVHSGTDWDDARWLTGQLPADFKWKPQAYKPAKVAGQLRALLEQFEESYHRPDYLLDALWQATEARDRGYVFLTGPGGAGKTFVVRGLAEQDGPKRGIPVLAYHILPGALSKYGTFLMELNDRARERAEWRVQEMQTNVPSLRDLRVQTVVFLTTLIEENRLDTLIVAVDGIDELPEPSVGQATITALLPDPDDLPLGCFILLTMRPRLRPTIAADLARLASGAVQVHIDPASDENGAVLRGYARNVLELAGYPHRADLTTANVDALRAQAAEAILVRAGGLFLYVAHLAHALATSAFSSPESLPSAAEFYPTYLARLREQVGDWLFTQRYLRLLVLLAAAREPITVTQMRRWGLADEDVTLLTLLTLREFLRVERARLPYESLAIDEGESRYGLAHDAFRQYLLGTPDLAAAVREAHRGMGQAAYNGHRGRWAAVDATSGEDLYDLQHVAEHLRAGGDEEGCAALWADVHYAVACETIGKRAQDQQCYSLAVTLYGAAVASYRSLVDTHRADLRFNFYGAAVASYRSLVDTHRADLRFNFAAMLMNWAAALDKLARYEEALAGHAEARAVFESLVAGGRENLRWQLVAVHQNTAITLGNLGRYEEARVEEDQALTLLPPWDTGERATLLSTRADTLGNLGLQTEALAGYDEALTHLRRLVDAGRTDLLPELARALQMRANTLHTLGRLAEARAGYVEARDMLQLLVTSGQTGLVANLTRVRLDLTDTLHTRSQQAEALAGCDQALAVLRPLVAKGRDDLRSDLGCVLMNRAVMLTRMARREDALAGFDEVLTHYRGLVDAGRTDLRPDLARGLMNRASTLHSLGRVEEALTGHDEALTHYRGLVDAGRADLRLELARALENRAITLHSLGRVEEALTGHDEALTHYRGLIDAGRADLRPDLARALENRAITLHSLGRYKQALAGYDEALDLLRPLVAGGRDDLQLDLFRVLMNRANVLRTLGRLVETLEEEDEGLALLGSLVANGRDDLVPELATALMNRAITLRALGRVEEALTGHDEALTHYRGLIDAGRTDLRPDLARALENRAITLHSLGRVEEALTGHDEALTHYRGLIDAGRADLRLELARALENRAITLHSLGRVEEALTGHDEALTHYRGLIDAGRADLRLELARALENRAITLHSLGRYKQALAGYDEALDLLRPLVAGGRDDLQLDLFRVLMNRANVLRTLGRLVETLEEEDEGLALLGSLVANGRDDLVPELATALMNRAITLRALGRVEEALTGHDEALTHLRRLVDEGCSDIRWLLLHTLHLKVIFALALERSDLVADAVNVACRYMLTDLGTSMSLENADIQAWQELLDTIAGSRLATDAAFYARLWDWGDEVRRQVAQHTADS